MHWVDWIITVVPVTIILFLAVYSRKYVRGVVDFLAAGRVAGRYVISAGDLTAGLSVITLVALVESKYQVGYALSFWEYLTVPVGIIMGLTGYCVYRFRETRSLSIGQFLEMRYNRSLRIVASTIRTFAEMVTNAIGPAVAANFFIYFIGLPHSVEIFGLALPTFGLVVAMSLCLCMVVLWPGGRISLLISDAFQGLMSYPIFVIIAGYIFLNFGWHDTIGPVMMDRVDGESFINPFDIEKLRDFNIFALFVTIFGSIMNRASWIGNDTTSSGRTPHEQKMAGILGTWRSLYSALMMLLIAVMIIALMTHKDYSDTAHEIRSELTHQVANEVVPDAGRRAQLDTKLSMIPVPRHEIGIDPPLSQESNIDTPYIEGARETLGGTPEGNRQFQEFRTLYHQMMLPVALKNLLPTGLMGLFCLLMVMLLISTDDSRVFNASSTIIQDIIMPFRKTPLTPAQHVLWLRLSSLGVCVFFFVVSIFFVQIDYIIMFTTIMTSLWLGGAGPIMIFGLYSRFGTTTGAFGALIFGSGLSLTGLFLQRNWAELVYPWLESNGWHVSVGHFLETVSSPFNPYVMWEMSAVKFPINSYELYFMAMISGITAYVVGSLLTQKEPYNLDRLLHRGEYDVAGEHKPKVAWSLRNTFSRLIGINAEYTLGDRIIAWSVFGYAIVYKFFFCFVCVFIWNLISPWPDEWWSNYFYITSLLVTAILGIVSTFWFLIGGVIDLRKLFRDLAARIDNPLDNGMVEGHVSLADKAKFEAHEQGEKKDQ
ncbi:sodium:solute symporter family protein [Puniceicoccus vermicola]|uniref:Sodium:panthothenate symporter n=1 Tax=Puniceicoccus vermicola TaxID=388746 RepID=A0A7X1AV14_9BACT|nr:sodium:panthothenate symporter [Puniceicoccus vermicola]MBC2600332.1 sodium:panthothenate symporter [Puniceicoccus vermicola]